MLQAADPAEEIAELQELVSGLGLSKGLTTALNSKLDESLAALELDTAAACDSLQAFLNELSGRGRPRPAREAGALADAPHAPA